MSDDGELLSDIDLSDGPATPTKERSPERSDDKGKAIGVGTTASENRHKEGDQQTKVFSSLFGDNEEEESSEDVWAVKPSSRAEPAAPSQSQSKSKNDEESRDKEANKSEDGAKDDGFIEGDREESSHEERAEAKLVQLPLLRLNRSPIDTFPDNAKVVIAKPPSTMGVQPTPFDEAYWDGSDMKPEVEPDPKRGGRLKVKRRIHDMLRWRMSAFGQKESNAKFVEFDDGSIVLYIGDEAYEIDSTTLKDSHHLFAQQTDDTPTDSAAEGPQTFLECDVPITERFTLVRSNVFDVVQKNLTVRMKALQQNKSTSKIVQHSVADPLADKEEKEKTEAAQSKLAAYGRRPFNVEPALTTEFLENNEDDIDARSRFGADEDAKAARLRNAKRSRDEDLEIEAGLDLKEEDDEGGLLDDEDEALFEDNDEDEEERPSKKARK